MLIAPDSDEDPPCMHGCFPCRCGPCQMIGPVFVTLSDNPKYANIVFLKVDVDEVQVGCEEAASSLLGTLCVTLGAGQTLQFGAGLSVLGMWNSVRNKTGGCR